MGSVCTCTIFQDDPPDVHDRRNQPSPQTRNGYQNMDTQSVSISQSYEPSQSYQPKSSISQKKSNINDRISIFEQQNNNKKSSKKTSIKTNTKSKPKKKWIVKGIDDKNKIKKIPINKKVINQNIVIEDEPSISMSHTDRMQMYQQDIANVKKKEIERSKQHKESRAGYSGVQISAHQKEMTRTLLEKRVEQQKKGAIGGIMIDDDPAGGYIDLGDDDDDQKDVNNTGNKVIKPKKKKKTLADILKDGKKEDSRKIISGIGLLKYENDIKLKRDVYEFNLNNNPLLKRLTDDQKSKLISFMAYCIIDGNISDKIEKVLMCNASINDKLLINFLDIIIRNKNNCFIRELWLESNPIGNDGINKISELINENISTLEVIKLYNNKKDISTQTCNTLINNLEKNNKIVKFTFEWRLTQQKDKVEKALRKNQDIKRKNKAKNK